MERTFLGRLALKPYGDELLTRGADFWVFSARLIILTMALAEALAWGYMGSLMSRANPLVAAVIAGTFVFALVWIIDASFMTLDLSRAFYEEALTGRKPNVLKERLKLAGGVAARVGIVTASLFITAPFLAQAIFAEDVQSEMTRRNANTVASRRQQLEQPFAGRLAELRREQQVLEGQRVAEVAGKGPSGKYGRGPALETIERQLGDKLREINAVESTRASALSRFDSLSRPQLAEQYGLRFLEPGVQANGDLLEDMLKNPQFTGAELAVRAFLGFLFLGLLILKAFQPRSVAVYFNEQLHSIHDQYRKGVFDRYLPEQDRNGSIDPLRFEDWCVTTYARIRAEDEHRRETAREVRVHELFIEQWQQLESSARAEREPLVQRRDELLAAIEKLQTEMSAADSSSRTLSEELRRIESAHASMAEHMRGGSMDGATFQQAMRASRELDELRRSIAPRASEAATTAERLGARVSTLSREAAAVDEAIAARDAVLADAQRRISAERMKVAETLASRRAALA